VTHTLHDRIVWVTQVYEAQHHVSQKSQRESNPLHGASTSASKRLAETVVFAGGGLDEINQSLLELKAGIFDIQQRLSAFEKQISDLGAAQQHAAITPTVSADLRWLSLAESAFAFWDNPADDIYDTLLTR